MTEKTTIRKLSAVEKGQVKDAQARRDAATYQPVQPARQLGVWKRADNGVVEIDSTLPGQTPVGQLRNMADPRTDPSLDRLHRTPPGQGEQLMSDPQPLDTLAAEDLHALAWLHEQERQPLALMELHRSGFPKTLSLLPASHDAVIRMDEALAAFDGIDPQGLADCADDLAADYAGIYLTHRLRAAPTESVWHDEEQLVMQAPTFAVREFYARHGMLVENWRHQPDDHLVHQLRFIAVLLERGEKKEAARFARTHLMTWLPQFTAQVEKLARTHLYARLATLTLACMQACLQRLPKVAVIPPVSVVTPAAGTPGCGSGRPQ